jgi:hypothetical protein
MRASPSSKVCHHLQPPRPRPRPPSTPTCMRCRKTFSASGPQLALYVITRREGLSGCQRGIVTLSHVR